MKKTILVSILCMALLGLLFVIIGVGNKSQAKMKNIFGEKLNNSNHNLSRSDGSALFFCLPGFSKILISPFGELTPPSERLSFCLSNSHISLVRLQT